MFSFERAVTNRRKEWTAAAVAVSGLMQARAADAAADKVAAGQRAARQTARQAGKEAADIQKEYYGQTREDFQPYIDAGAYGIGRYMQEAEQGFNLPEFQQPTEQDMMLDPGYQFRLNQGIEATTRALTKSGQAWGGRRGIALMDYAQGLASQEYGNVYNRALQNYQTNYGRRTDILNRYAGIADVGRSATTNLGSIGQAYAANIGQSITGTGRQVAATQTGEANAYAAGTIGKARGYGKAIEAIGGGMSAYGGDDE